MADETITPEEQLRSAARDLARIRKRPCLIFSSSTIDGHDVLTLTELCRHRSGDVDVVIHGPGGYPHAAYLAARTLRRHFEHVAAFVPIEAKSAATLLSLVADELVLGELGELGPLDVQFSEKQRNDVPVNRSCLERFQALDQLYEYAQHTFDGMVKDAIEENGMRADEACRVATDFASKICGPMYAQVDPEQLAESARHLKVGLLYADRILRRYRPQLYAEAGPAIIERLVKAYPSHDFVIDKEELLEIGLPVRDPSAEESPIIERFARELARFGDERTLIELVDCDESAPAPAPPDGKSGSQRLEGTASGAARDDGQTEEGIDVDCD